MYKAGSDAHVSDSFGTTASHLAKQTTKKPVFSPMQESTQLLHSLLTLKPGRHFSNCPVISMKKFFSTASVMMLLVSLVSFAQTQNPIRIGGKENLEEAIRQSQVTTVAITVTSLSKAYDYEITVDGQIVDRTGMIPSYSSRKIQVPLKFSVANKPQTFEICSISTPNSEYEFVRTRVCSKAQLVWLK